MNDLLARLLASHCRRLPAGSAPLAPGEVLERLAVLPAWVLSAGSITRTFRFRDYWETIAFVNASAWLSQREDHHPDLLVTYRECQVTYTTHSLGGITENDLICAAKLDALVQP